jgi:pimeloyl-ACP methyl ester carboxylesterase
MPFFDSAGATIHYLDQGNGNLAVLIHSMASNLHHSWVDTGWIDHLRQNYRVIALDCRGHGLSEKSYDPDFYTADKMADDVVRLLDHLGVPRTLVAGHSMGSSVERMLKDVTGFTLTLNPQDIERLVETLNADDPASCTDQAALFIRSFCEKNGNDPKALAAFSLHRRPDVVREELAAIRAPVLIMAGTRDSIVQGVDELVGSIPGAKMMKREGRTHLDALADRFSGRRPRISSPPLRLESGN